MNLTTSIASTLMAAAITVAPPPARGSDTLTGCRWDISLTGWAGSQLVFTTQVADGHDGYLLRGYFHWFLEEEGNFIGKEHFLASLDAFGNLTTGHVGACPDPVALGGLHTYWARLEGEVLVDGGWARSCGGCGEANGCNGTTSSAWSAVRQPCPGDISFPFGTTDTSDLLDVLADWGDCDPNCLISCESDLDGDGTVGTKDLLKLLAHWGSCPS